MVNRRCIVMVLTAFLMVSSISFSRAEETAPQREQNHPEQSGPSGGAVAAAVIADFFYIPGKVGVCITSSALYTIGMALTGGMIYREAGNFVHDSCGGTWVLTGEDFMGAEDKT